jgi:hypothetical protein
LPAGILVRMEREAAIAHVTEEFGDDRLGPIATGQFQVRLQTWPDGDAWEMLEGSWPLDQALAQARERAARVVVQPAGFGMGRYTAGDTPVDEPPVSEAPTLPAGDATGWPAARANTRLDQTAVGVAWTERFGS